MKRNEEKYKRFGISAFIITGTYFVTSLALMVIDPPEYNVIAGVLSIFYGTSFAILYGCMFKIDSELIEEKHYMTVFAVAHLICMFCGGARNILMYVSPTLTVIIRVLEFFWAVSFVTLLVAFFKGMFYLETQRKINIQKLKQAITALDELESEWRAERRAEEAQDKKK